GMLMAHFLDDDFVPEALELADGVYRDEYYVKMMKAWFFATALAKQYDAAIPYYERGFGDEEVKRMTKRKCLDSFRISEEKKNYIKNH
ncbi:MAG: DNA alkylation repair protein, partial [Clostridia bacterium]|nr:DNA alkylation repair protein [Clostridia bacterium]